MQMYADGQLLGNLQGANYSWSITSFNVSAEALSDGMLNVFINIDSTHTRYWWAVTIGWSKLTVVWEPIELKTTQDAIDILNSINLHLPTIMPEGNAKSISAKLDAAIRSLQELSFPSAFNQLNAAINELRVLSRKFESLHDILESKARTLESIPIFFQAQEPEKAKKKYVLVVLQYDPDKKGPEIAGNETFRESAKARAKELEEEGAEVIVYIVDLTDKDQDNNSIEDVLNKKLPEDNKGNVDWVEVFGHGVGGGSGGLDLPYDAHPNDVPGNDTTLGNIGAPAGSSLDMLPGGRKEAIKKLAEKLKEILKKDGGVVFYGCWNGINGGIAQLVSQAGVKAQGYTGLVEYPYEEEKGKPVKYYPPKPAENTILQTHQLAPVEDPPEDILSLSKR